MDIWEVCKRAREEVDKWPEWKRNIKVTSYSGMTKEEAIEYNKQQYYIIQEGRHFG